MDEKSSEFYEMRAANAVLLNSVLISQITKLAKNRHETMTGFAECQCAQTGRF